jgi:hypothetical protein
MGKELDSMKKLIYTIALILGVITNTYSQEYNVIKDLFESEEISSWIDSCAQQHDTSTIQKYCVYVVEIMSIDSSTHKISVVCRTIFSFNEYKAYELRTLHFRYISGIPVVILTPDDGFIARNFKYYVYQKGKAVRVARILFPPMRYAYIKRENIRKKHISFKLNAIEEKAESVTK